MSVDEKYALIASIAQDPALSLEEKNSKIIEITTGASKKQEDNNSTQANGSTDMSAAERLSIVTNNLQEILNPEIMEDVLNKGEKPLTIYWGMLKGTE
jgi:hypothetical protein